MKNESKFIVWSRRIAPVLLTGLAFGLLAMGVWLHFGTAAGVFAAGICLLLFTAFTKWD